MVDRIGNVVGYERTHFFELQWNGVEIKSSFLVY